MQTLGDSEGQGSLECCSLRGREELGTTWRLNNNKCKAFFLLFTSFFFVLEQKQKYSSRDVMKKIKFPS